MAIPDATRSDGALIANQYQVDPNKKLPPAGGLAAFGAIDRLAGRTDLMAIQLSRRWPPRSRALQALAAPIEGLLTPLAYGPAGNVCYTICPAPPGPSVQSRSRPWPEMELLECVLRPAAHALEKSARAGHHSSQHSARQCLSERTKPTGRPGLRLGNATSDGSAGAVRATLFGDVPAGGAR